MNVIELVNQAVDDLKPAFSDHARRSEGWFAVIEGDSDPSNRSNWRLVTGLEFDRLCKSDILRYDRYGYQCSCGCGQRPSSPTTEEVWLSDLGSYRLVPIGKMRPAGPTAFMHLPTVGL